MKLPDLVRVLQRTWFVVVAVTALGVIAAGAALLLVNPRYDAVSRLFVSTQSLGSVTDLYQGATYTQNRMTSYAKVATDPIVLQPVIDQLDLPFTPEELAANVTSEAITDSLILEISVADDDSARAADTVNAIAAELSSVIMTDLESPVTGSQSLVSVSVTKEATPEATPSSPVPWLFLTVGGVGGLLLGLGLAFLLNAFETRIRTIDELKRNVDLPILGLLTYDRDVAKDPLVAQARPSSPRAEAFRSLRTNLGYLDVRKRRQVLLITSSIPDEGKSLTSANLAISLAQSGQRTLLLDADLRKPTVAEYLGIEGAVGLSDILIGRVEPESVIQPWGLVEGLDVLASGPTPPNPGELLGSEALVALIDRFRGSYDRIVIDSPPTLPVADAAILSRVVDGVVLVVGAGRVRTAQLVTSIETLGRVGADILGLIGNRMPRRGVDAYSYYAYGYESTVSAPSHAKPATSSENEAEPETADSTHAHAHARTPDAKPGADADVTADSAADDTTDARVPSGRGRRS